MVLQQTAKTCQYGEKNAEKMQKSDFFCIFLSGRAASTTSFPSQAPLETKKAVTRLIPASALYTLHFTPQLAA